jgi:arginase family enzyme
MTLKVFGASLDPLDGTEKVEIKRAYVSALCAGIEIDPNFLDPYDGICSVNPDLFKVVCEKAGRMPVESWLTPKPECEDLPKITADSYKTFLESNGCYRYSVTAGAFLDQILPNPFAMLGVDHSQTGGVVRRLSEAYGPDQMSLIVLDAHTDMFDFDLLYAAQGELLQKQGLGGRLPKVLYANNFYGCGNFLDSLIRDGAILPQNLFIIGVTDYPGGLVSNREDPKVGRYIEAYEDNLKRGVNIVPQAQIGSSAEKVSKVLNAINTPYVYLSIDMDVGAFFTTCAVRFLNTAGVSEDCLYGLVNIIKDAVNRKNARLIGMDLMELDVHYAGYFIGGKKDRSYEITGNLIKLLATGL